MSEKLDNAIANLIEKATNGADAAADFLNAEIPGYIQELLTWYMTYSLILCVIGVIYLVAWVNIDYRVGRRCWAEMQKSSSYCARDDFNFYYVFLGSLARVILLGIPLVATLNLNWLQIWMSPKVWLVEYASKLAG